MVVVWWNLVGSHRVKNGGGGGGGGTILKRERIKKTLNK